MSNPDPRGDPNSRDKRSLGDAFSDAVKETLAQAGDAAREASDKARSTATESASTVTGQVKDAVNRQIDNGVRMAEQFAKSARVAADDLHGASPGLSKAVHSIATQVEDYAADLHGQTIDEIAHRVSDFTRRQPAVVFGVSAVAGFLVFRAVKSARAMASAPKHDQELMPNR